MAAGNAYFVIVGRNDRPLFELEFSAKAAVDGKERDRPVDSHIYYQLVAHSVLNLVDALCMRPGQSQCYYKSVEQINDLTVSAFVMPSSVKLLLLHRLVKAEEDVRTFFQEVAELYTKLALNPFYKHGSLIQNSAFDKNVRLVAKNHLKLQ